MAFQAPVFNIVCNLWRAPATTADPPTAVYACQLYIPPRSQFDVKPTVYEEYNPSVQLRLPIGTDVAVDDIVEVGNGDGWFYIVRWHDRQHRGFPNEYTLAILEQDTTGPPSATGGILMEDGIFYILTEAGDRIGVQA